MEEFLTYLISPILSVPSELKITTTVNTVTIQVSDSDIARVIGKHGSVIHNIRTLFKTYCANLKLTPSTLILNSPPKTV